MKNSNNFSHNIVYAIVTNHQNFNFILKNIFLYGIIIINIYGSKPYKKLWMFIIMKPIQTINKANLKESAKKGGCGKCQASCQSACKTSCTVANQKCER